MPDKEFAAERRLDERGGRAGKRPQASAPTEIRAAETMAGLQAVVQVPVHEKEGARSRAAL